MKVVRHYIMRRLMYKLSGEFNRLNIGGTSRWRPENWEASPNYFSLGISILKYPEGLISQLKNSYGTILQDQD